MAERYLVELPPDARAVYVLAHGAGAGMRHPFLAAISRALAARGVGTLRYEFPYMAAKRGRPDSPEVCHATVRDAVAEATRRAPGLPLLAGGKSFGGRMTSQAAAAASLPGVTALVFLGFPLHAPAKPGSERAEHLARVTVPMLFLQGTRDTFAQLELLQPVVAALPRATLHLIPDADHSFHVPKSTGRTDAGVLDELAETIAESRSLWDRVARP